MTVNQAPYETHNFSKMTDSKLKVSHKIFNIVICTPALTAKIRTSTHMAL